MFLFLKKNYKIDRFNTGAHFIKNTGGQCYLKDMSTVNCGKTSKELHFLQYFFLILSINVENNILVIEREVSGQNGLFEQLHEVTVLCGGQVGEDVVTLRRKTTHENSHEKNNHSQLLVIVVRKKKKKNPQIIKSLK